MRFFYKNMNTIVTTVIIVVGIIVVLGIGKMFISGELKDCTLYSINNNSTTYMCAKGNTITVPSQNGK